MPTIIPDNFILRTISNNFDSSDWTNSLPTYFSNRTEIFEFIESFRDTINNNDHDHAIIFDSLSHVSNTIPIRGVENLIMFQQYVKYHNNQIRETFIYLGVWKKHIIKLCLNEYSAVERGHHNVIDMSYLSDAGITPYDDDGITYNPTNRVCQRNDNEIESIDFLSIDFHFRAYITYNKELIYGLTHSLLNSKQEHPIISRILVKVREAYRNFL